MTGFPAAEAKLLFDASFVFFWGEFGDFDSIDDHGVGVVGLGIRGVGEGVVGLVRGPCVSLGDVVGSLPLGLEGDGFLVSFVNGGGNGIHGHDVAHQGWWDSCGEVSDQDVGIRDVGKGYMILEGGNIFG